MAAPVRKIADKFCNTAYALVVQSGANTLTYQEIQTGMSVFEKVAWIIHAIEYHIPHSARALIIDASDYIDMALTVSNTPTLISPSMASVIDTLQLVAGATANRIDWYSPIVHDFSNWPGGGLIVPGKPLYAAVDADSLASAAQVDFRIRFTYRPLKAEEYWELVEASRIIE